MTTRLRQWLCLISLLCAAGTQQAQAQTAAPDAQPEVLQALQLLHQPRLVGTARLTVWGFQIYDARLWAPARFAASGFAASPMALELHYLRDFKALDIAERSLLEMRRSQAISTAQAALWKAEMLRVIPDIAKGGRILGVHRPGRGADFWVNGQASGEIRDAEFARLFFGIWLSPNTSEPQMRKALLAGASE